MCHLVVQIRFCSQCQTNQTTFSNITAIKLLDGLRTGKKYSNHQQSELVVNEAIKAYHHITDSTNYGTMSALMKLLLHFKQPHKVYSIWDDIINTDRLSFPLLMKCCISTNAKDFSMDKCIEILFKMRVIDYELRQHEILDFSRSVCQLVTRCKTYDELKSVQDLIEPYYDIYNQTALIVTYGKIKHPERIQNARNIFNEIKKEKMNTIGINAMMTLYVNHDYFKEGLEIYEEYVSLRDNVSHKLALRACINLNDESKGFEIANRVNKNTDPQLKASLIDFYGLFNDLHSAMTVFNSIPDETMDVSHIGAIMKAFVYNNRFQPALDIYDANESLQNDITDLLAITACRRLSNWMRGKLIHDKIKTRGYPMTIELQNALIDFYRHFQQFDKVKEIFESMETMNTKTINSVMMNLMNNQQYQLTLDLYQSKSDKLKNNVTHILALKACINIGDDSKLQELLDTLKDDINLMADIRDETVKYNPCIIAHTVECLVGCGKFKQCKDLILKYEEFSQSIASSDIWMVLLNGCQHDTDFMKDVYKDLIVRFRDDQIVMNSASEIVDNKDTDRP